MAYNYGGRMQNGVQHFLINFAATHTTLLQIASTWLYEVNSILPEPYLDEVFHVRQAQAYWAHQWHVWDPKITTPPGLYIVSYPWIFIQRLVRSPLYDAQALRMINALVVVVLLPFQARKLLDLSSLRRFNNENGCTEDKKKSEEVDGLPLPIITHTAWNICFFPPLFFFSALYYTDVLSASCVLQAYIAYLQRGQTVNVPPKAQHHDDDRSSLQAYPKKVSYAWRLWSSDIALWGFGLSALLFRQTNIFWVAIFLAGLEIIRTVKRNHTTSLNGDSTSFAGIIGGSWHRGTIYDPLVKEACIEDYLKTALSLVTGTAANLKTVSQSVIPYLFFLAAFGGFVVWNGSVVLGHKEFHTAALHLPQMLYIWPNFMFFSFPIIYPYLLNSTVPQNLLPRFLRFGSTRDRLPRPIIAIAVVGLMSITVYLNTIIHPFTLADNRHYIFYIFRILLHHPSIKYLAVPAYFICAWAAIAALGGMPDQAASPASPRTERAKDSNTDNAKTISEPQLSHHKEGNRVSFVLVWLAATSLSLITAPLVEPRYLIIPWLIWRLHIPILPILGSQQNGEQNNAAWPFGWLDTIKLLAYRQHDHRLWLETIWFLLVNWGTGYVFLHWGFEWPQEPGKVQRFMW
ncbi:MAG: hypothetical protein M1830_004324 [Pleopsidium flavum]|nr:MAG: hypothetical protein M1830_004324 [Pleopsidium flavum]